MKSKELALKESFNKLWRELWEGIEAQHGRIIDEYKESYREDITEEFKCGRETILEDWTGIINTHIEKARLLMGQFMKDERNKPKEQTEQKRVQGKTYMKCLERRVHILDFCFDFYGTDSWPGWDQLAVLWNEKHPSDQMTSDTLKAAFSKAKRDKQAIFNWSLMQIGPIEIEWTGSGHKLVFTAEELLKIGGTQCQEIQK
jgi:hypothetical protein